MRLPSPARAATAAGILLATSVLLLAGDLAIVQMGGDSAHFIPFTIEGDNVTVVGMRIINSGSFDSIRAYEMLGEAACGAATRQPIVFGENGTVAPEDQRVVGNVSLYVLESVHTADLVRGEPVPTYLERHRRGELGPGGWVLREAPLENGTEEGEEMGDVVIRRVSLRIHVVCQWPGDLEFERGPHPGTNVRYSFSSADPWVSDLPVNQGVDLVYVLRADEQPDDETYTVLAGELRRGSEFWMYSMSQATVFDDEAVVPELVLRAAMVATLAMAIGCLLLALRRTPPVAAMAVTDAALALATAGERHLMRLRQTWGLVGALLVPLLAAATYVLFAVIPFTAPTPRWETMIGVLVIALDAAVLALWALAWWRAHRDLVAWRKAWTRLDDAGLDGL